MSIELRHLAPEDFKLMHALLRTFGEVFDDAETYVDNRPSTDYLRKLLGSDHFIALTALTDGEVVGGLTAYELTKYEQERCEIYIYDLAVLSEHRRQGVATALIEKLKTIAADRGAYVVIVQADTGVEDAPAIALYTRFGNREEVLHFDIPIDAGSGTS